MALKVLTTLDMAYAACKVAGKWGMFISINTPDNSDHWDDIDETLKAGPWLNVCDHMQLLTDKVGLVLFDSETEAWDIYGQTVGDEGPTKTNKYNGPGNIYALLIDAGGHAITENT
jgi:hypothetical protein